MAILGLGDYLCEACKWFDTDGEDGNHPYCIRQSCVDTPPGIAVRLGDECPFGYEFGVPSGYPVSIKDNERRAYEIKAMLENRGGAMSYRLINANAIAELLPEVNDMPCIYADLPSGLDGGHYDMREIERVKDENTKLRELLVDCLLTPETYGEKYGLEQNFIVCSNHWGDRMRAMGIEVV